MKSTWTKSTNQYFGELFEIALCNELDVNKKKTSNGAYKGIPDFLAICNHRNGSCRVFKKNQLVNLSSASSVKVKGFSITVKYTRLKSCASGC